MSEPNSRSPTPDHLHRRSRSHSRSERRAPLSRHPHSPPAHQSNSTSPRCRSATRPWSTSRSRSPSHDGLLRFNYAASRNDVENFTPIEVPEFVPLSEGLSTSVRQPSLLVNSSLPARNPWFSRLLRHGAQPNVAKPCLYFFCGNSSSVGRCARCMQARYCSAHCQSEDWNRHREYCELECKSNNVFSCDPCFYKCTNCWSRTLEWCDSCAHEPNNPANPSLFGAPLCSTCRTTHTACLKCLQRAPPAEPEPRKCDRCVSQTLNWCTDCFEQRTHEGRPTIPLCIECTSLFDSALTAPMTSATATPPTSPKHPHQPLQLQSCLPRQTP